MALNDYRCPKHGEMEIHFRVGYPPKVCPERGCRCKLDLIPAIRQFGIGGDNWFNHVSENVIDKLEHQLPERPRSPEHLRQLERQCGAERKDFGERIER